MITRPFAVTVLALAAAAPAQQALPLPALTAATRVAETSSGATRSFAELLDALAKLDVVFLGETHVDDTTHRIEVAVLEGLLERRQGKVVLSMEMFERDSQPVLDAYLAGKIDEEEFVATSGAWQNYRTGYRGLIETAKAAGIPVVAANFPRSLRRLLMRGGKAAIDRLTPEQRALMPDEIFPASAEYWARVDRAVRGHMGGMGMGGGGTPEARLYDTQNLWDNSMGDNIAKARAAHPEALVLHVAGGFHVAYRDGTVAQFVRRSPECRCAVVQVASAGGVELGRPERDREIADWMVYARHVARGHNEGTFAVATSAELRYRLEVPAGKTGLPLLIWLPGRQTRPEDAFARWRTALGDEAAVAVVEHPIPELQDDLGLGGRYAFGDGFRADYGRVMEGLVRIAEYVTRHYGVDPARVLVAGEGDGGAVVLWTALYGEWLAQDFVAVDPTDLTRLSMEALPDQKPVARSLTLLVEGTPGSQLLKTGADYVKVGVPTELHGLGGKALAAALREHLGLAPRELAGEEVALVLERELPRARAWAEILAARLSAEGRRVTVRVGAAAADGDVRKLAVGGDGLWPLTTFAEGEGLPLAGGPFGGTTVVVLLPETSAADRATWFGYAERKVIKRRNMFANIAVAELDGDRSLPEVVAELQAMGRSRVLFVPAVFCADPATMRGLKAALGSAAEGMDVAWLPGLGAELVLDRR